MDISYNVTNKRGGDARGKCDLYFENKVNDDRGRYDGLAWNNEAVSSV